MYMGVGVKLVLNMHDLNNERAEEIRRIPLIYRDGKGEWQVVEEAVAISGVMVKHWHFAYMVALGNKDENVGFCDYCKRFEAIRVLSGTQGTEKDLIDRCAGEDVHGFLRAKPPLRRESLARFSWMLPLFNEKAMKTFGLSTPFRVLQHSRNVREIPEKAPDEVRQAQMPYPRSYANGVYGFVSTLDLDHVGHSFISQESIDAKKVVARKKIAVQAYVPMLTGAMGASLARALPVSEVLEVVVVTCAKPIPAPVHPIYPDFVGENVSLYTGIDKVMETDVTMYAWSMERKIESRDQDSFKLVSVKNPSDAFAKVIETLNTLPKESNSTKGK